MLLVSGGFRWFLVLETTINRRVTTSQFEIYLISDQNSHLLSQNVFFQSIIYPTEKTIHWNKQHFGMR